MEKRYSVTNARVETESCILTDLDTGEEFKVKLDNWEWRNSFVAEIYFSFRGRKFSTICELEPVYPDWY